MTQRKDLTCPRKQFYDNLLTQLEKWRREEDCLVDCLDTNDDIYKKSLGQSRTNQDGLKMSKVVGDYTGKKICPISTFED